MCRVLLSVWFDRKCRQSVSPVSTLSCMHGLDTPYLWSVLAIPSDPHLVFLSRIYTDNSLSIYEKFNIYSFTFWMNVNSWNMLICI